MNTLSDFHVRDFHMGDRVMIIKSGPTYDGITGTITRIQGIPPSLHYMDEAIRGFYAFNLLLLATEHDLAITELGEAYFE